MTKKIKFLIIALLILLAGCEKSRLSFLPAAQSEPMTLIIPVGRHDMIEAQKQAVILCDSLGKEGFQVEIELFNRDQKDAINTYADFLNEKLQNENTFAFMGELMVDGIKDNTALGNLASSVSQDSIYGKFMGDLVYTEAPLIPLEEGALYYNSVVLIKKEIHDAYGREISTSQDYLNFLKWAKEKADLIPGTIYRVLNTSTPEMTLLNWLLPTFGYISLDPLLNYPVFLALDAADLNQIVQVDKTDIYHDLLNLTGQISRHGLMDLSLPAGSFTDMGKSASLIMNYQDFIVLSQNPPPSYLAHDYVVKFLNPRKSLVIHGGSYAAMGPQGKANEFLRLLDWFFEDWENFGHTMGEGFFSFYFSDLNRLNPEFSRLYPDNTQEEKDSLEPIDPELCRKYLNRSISLVMEYDGEYNSRKRLARIRSQQVKTTLLLASLSHSDNLLIETEYNDFEDILLFLSRGE